MPMKGEIAMKKKLDLRVDLKAAKNKLEETLSKVVRTGIKSGWPSQVPPGGARCGCCIRG